MTPHIFIELAVILLITLLLAGVMRALKQPLIIGYIIAGILAGPFAFDLLQSEQTFQAFAQIGIALLLFIVGINLNPRQIKDLGKVSILTGVGQVIFTSLFGFLLCVLFGFSIIEAMYIGVALTFSSTIIIMKLLSDKNDIETLYGRIAIGFLIVQDLIVIFILIALSSLSSSINQLPTTLVLGTGMILVVLLFGWKLLPKITDYIAKSQELLLLFSIGWCFAVATLFNYLQFSLEAGALLAGITLSFSQYHYEISAKIRPLRDFFLIVFFVVLGSELIFQTISTVWVPVVVLSLFILIGNPLIVMSIMGMMGYTKRNGFLAGLTVAQISEFSLVLITLGVTSGHLSTEIQALVTMVGLITIAGSTYMITYSHKIYPKISPLLSIFEKKGEKVDEHQYQNEKAYDIILFGAERIGTELLDSIRKLKKKVLIIDFDPNVIQRLSKKYDCRYGDANDLELLNDLPLKKAKMIISTISEIDTDLLLIKEIRAINKKSIVAVVSHHVEEATALYHAGATYVIMPHFLGGKHLSAMLKKNKLNADKFLKDKIVHQKHLGMK